ncbi:MAG: fatty acid desaturase [Phycisphaerales bacterium]|nr:fatty acid desaturase [Phycisphaerales bacterium]
MPAPTTPDRTDNRQRRAASEEVVKHRAEVARWKAIVANYQQPHAGRATWQLVTTLGSYLAVWFLIYLTLDVSWWLTVPLALLAGGLLVRVFIIFHDCGHGSFFASRFANDFWGCVTGLLTFTPYYHWRGEHAIHHGATGDLERRGVGDIWTMTVQEYIESSRWKRFSYRLARNPFVLFVLAPVVLFLIVQRFPRKGATKVERHSVWWMNFAALVFVATMSLVFGLVPFILLQLFVMMVAGSAGVWLFYLQHQFEDVYWERSENWDYAAAALQGSSFFKLPRILQWFSGNIGFHHIHHLSPRIPNYNLERCHHSDPMFQEVKPMTLFGSIKSLGLRLWDESSKKLVGWRHVRQVRKAVRDAARSAASNGTANGVAPTAVADQTPGDK